MAIPSSGVISLTTVQTEFGGSNPIGINEYYAGGGLVPAATVGTNGPVPSSGQIALSNFYGTSNYIAPTSVSYLVVAGGGGGGGFYITGQGQSGGGAGGMQTGTLPVSASTTYTVTVGGGGPGGTNADAEPALGSKGSDSVFSSITSTGGGGGGYYFSAGQTRRNGGSGGGSNNQNVVAVEKALLGKHRPLSLGLAQVVMGATVVLLP